GDLDEDPPAALEEEVDDAGGDGEVVALDAVRGLVRDPVDVAPEREGPAERGRGGGGERVRGRDDRVVARREGAREVPLVEGAAIVGERGAVERHHAGVLRP